MLVEVIQARGSVPREAGTRMLVAADEVAGTIGGGHPVALGPSLGQCCGGALTLRFTMLDEAIVTAWPEPPPRFTLHLFGAGHVGRALVQVLAEVPCRVVWVDEREDEFPATLLAANVERVCVEPVEAEVANGRPGDFYLVLTHSHALDLALSEAILKRGDFGWFGLIGSATKRARFEHRLRERGIGEALLARMVCPIGMPGIEGKQPGVIAVAVAAQLLARPARNGERI